MRLLWKIAFTGGGVGGPPDWPKVFCKPFSGVSPFALGVSGGRFVAQLTRHELISIEIQQVLWTVISSLTLPLSWPRMML